MTRYVRMVAGICGVLLLGYGIYSGVFVMMQRQFLFPGTQIAAPPTGAERLPGVEQIWLATSFGQVEAWFLPPELESGIQAAPAVIFAHGNAELIDDWPDDLQPFTQLGIGVLLVEYPGYGRSAGEPSQRSITETFVTAYDILTARDDVDADRIILLGRSLGGGAVCALAAERPAAALILMSTFTSVPAFVEHLAVPDVLIQDPFDNLAVVRSYPGPVLVIHGEYDTLIPYTQGVALAQAAQHGTLVTYVCGHNDCPPSWNVYWRDVAAFLERAGIITAGA